MTDLLVWRSESVSDSGSGDEGGVYIEFLPTMAWRALVRYPSGVAKIKQQNRDENIRIDQTHPPNFSVVLQERGWRGVEENMESSSHHLTWKYRLETDELLNSHCHLLWGSMALVGTQKRHEAVDNLPVDRHDRLDCRVELEVEKRWELLY